MSTNIESQEFDLSVFDDYSPITSESVVTGDVPQMVLKDEEVVIPEIGEEVENTDDLITKITNEPINEIKNSSLTESFKSLFEENVLLPFDDEKDISEYSKDELKELIKANFDHKQEELKQNITNEVVNSFPEELKYLVDYFNKGGKDVKGMFKLVADSFENSDLDLESPKDQEFIVRKYLESTNFGNGDVDLVEEQIEEWKESNVLSKKALSFKPKLDELNEKSVQDRIVKQEEFNKKQKEKKKEYLDNIYNTLKPAELNGIKLNEKRQQFLWDELTTLKYESLTGRPTNLLGKLLEDYQFGEKPRYDLIAEATWLLSDPEDYKNNIKTAVIKEVNKETIKKLKTEEGRNNTTNNITDTDQKKNKIAKPANNIFKF